MPLRRVGMRRGSFEVNVVMSHRVGEELEPPVWCAIAEGQRAEGGSDGDGDLENGCAYRYLEG